MLRGAAAGVGEAVHPSQKQHGQRGQKARERSAHLARREGGRVGESPGCGSLLLPPHPGTQARGRADGRARALGLPGSASAAVPKAGAGRRTRGASAGGPESFSGASPLARGGLRKGELRRPRSLRLRFLRGCRLPSMEVFSSAAFGFLMGSGDSLPLLPVALGQAGGSPAPVSALARLSLPSPLAPVARLRLCSLRLTDPPPSPPPSLLWGSPLPSGQPRQRIRDFSPGSERACLPACLSGLGFAVIKGDARRARAPPTPRRDSPASLLPFPCLLSKAVTLISTLLLNRGLIPAADALPQGFPGSSRLTKPLEESRFSHSQNTLGTQATQRNALPASPCCRRSMTLVLDVKCHLRV